MLLAAATLLSGCKALVQMTDRDISLAIAERQRAALDYGAPIPLNETDRPEPLPDKAAYIRNPSPSSTRLPSGFEPSAAPVTAPPTDNMPASQPNDARTLAASRPRRYRDRVFTLTDAITYSLQHRRAYQSAKEDLYLSALALTLERHLWTPQFAAELRTVYGNFGEIRKFDQAMRFVSDLSVSQRLPYGGDFTARAVNTLIRDVKQTITASETGQIQFDLRIPFLRGAGHVSHEALIQLERDLTYAVRDFERFRRQQVVQIARQYFDLLRSKQEVIDAEDSVERAAVDFDRAAAIEDAAPIDAAVTAPLDTRRAQQRLLSEESRAATLRETFRFATDQFKLLIGMPVDDMLGIEDFEDIESIERRIVSGAAPLLGRPEAAGDERRSLAVATQYRLDLLTRRDQIDDAKRGVSIARNDLLPNFDWNSSLTFDTDPLHFNSGAFETNRATWRSEVVLSMNDRFAERNRYRSSLIDVRRSERNYIDTLEQVRVDVRRAVNQLRLQDRVLKIQIENVSVAEFRAEFAREQFNNGDLGNRDVVEAEDELIRAQNSLNRAKTSSWSALLDFRLATETLRFDDSGGRGDHPGNEG